MCEKMCTSVVKCMDNWFYMLIWLLVYVCPSTVLKLFAPAWLKPLLSWALCPLLWNFTESHPLISFATVVLLLLFPSDVSMISDSDTVTSKHKCVIHPSSQSALYHSYDICDVCVDWDFKTWDNVQGHTSGYNSVFKSKQLSKGKHVKNELVTFCSEFLCSHMQALAP